jgi:hypothetical protein
MKRIDIIKNKIIKYEFQFENFNNNWADSLQKNKMDIS